MSFKHNKKRNAGLIYEFFIRSIGSNVLAGNTEAITNAKKLFRKYFQPGTALYNETKLFKAVMNTRGVTKQKAEYILNHIKAKCKLNETVLELEKTALIHEINKILGPSFFDTEVENFKNYASLQILLNNWRSETISESIEDLSILEDGLKVMMQEPKKEIIDFSSKTQEEIGSFIAEQTKTKLSNNLLPEQANLLALYVNPSTPKTIVRNELNNQVNKTKSWLLEENKKTSLPLDTMQKFEKLVNKLEFVTKEPEISDRTIELFLGAIKVREECSSKGLKND